MSKKMRRKEALMASFKCIDWKKEGFIRYDNWNETLKTAFGSRITEENSKKSFNLLSGNPHGILSLENFIYLHEIALFETRILHLNSYELYPWKKLKSVLRSYLKLDKVVKNVWFEVVVLIIILLNGALMVYEFI
jgi:hypothetical protein